MNTDYWPELVADIGARRWTPGVGTVGQILLSEAIDEEGSHRAGLRLLRAFAASSLHRAGLWWATVLDSVPSAVDQSDLRWVMAAWTDFLEETAA